MANPSLQPLGHWQASNARSYNAISIMGNNMECTVSWLGGNGMSFAAETGSGHLVTMDGAPDAGGRNLAPRPMEMVLVGTGGCTAFDVVLILKRGRQPVTGCSVALTAERAADDPKVFTAINFHFTVTGRGLDSAKVARAIDLSHEKYCSATIMLARTASITHSFDIVDTAVAAV
jgi:putative redox protein